LCQPRTNKQEIALAQGTFPVTTLALVLLYGQARRD